MQKKTGELLLVTEGRRGEDIHAVRTTYCVAVHDKIKGQGKKMKINLVKHNLQPSMTMHYDVTMGILTTAVSVWRYNSICCIYR